MGPIDWNAAKVGLDLIQMAFTGAVAVYVFWTNKYRANASAIRALNKRIDGLDGHVGRLEQTISHQPGYGDLDKLRDEMSHTNRELAEVSAQLKATSVLLDRVHEFLLNERGNR